MATFCRWPPDRFVQADDRIHHPLVDAGNLARPDDVVIRQPRTVQRDIVAQGFVEHRGFLMHIRQPAGLPSAVRVVNPASAVVDGHRATDGFDESGEQFQQRAFAHVGQTYDT